MKIWRVDRPAEPTKFMIGMGKTPKSVEFGTKCRGREVIGNTPMFDLTVRNNVWVKRRSKTGGYCSPFGCRGENASRQNVFNESDYGPTWVD